MAARRPPARRLALEGELTINLNVSSGGTAGDNDALNQILALLGQSAEREQAMSQELDQLTTDVQENTDATEGVKAVVLNAATLLAELKADLDAAGTDPAALAALSEKIDQNSNDLTGAADTLSAAVVANTPAAS